VCPFVINTYHCSNICRILLFIKKDLNSGKKKLLIIVDPNGGRWGRRTRRHFYRHCVEHTTYIFANRYRALKIDRKHLFNSFCPQVDLRFIKCNSSMNILCKSLWSFDIYLHHQYWLFLDGETGTNHAIQLYVYSSSIKGVEVQCTKQSAYKSATARTVM
jgi:hypothetical protein